MNIRMRMKWIAFLCGAIMCIMPAFAWVSLSIGWIVWSSGLGLTCFSLYLFGKEGKSNG